MSNNHYYYNVINYHSHTNCVFYFNHVLHRNVENDGYIYYDILYEHHLMFKDFI